MIDLESVFIGIGMLLIFVVPFIYVQYRHKSLDKKQKKNLLEKAKANNLNLTQYEVWANAYGIGIDENSNTIYYLKNSKAENVEHAVALKSIASCKKITLKDSLGNSQYVNLILKNKNESAADIRLEFFSHKQKSTLFKADPLASKWEQIIAKAIKK